MIRARSVHHIPGGVTIRDYRGTGLCPPVTGGGRPVTITPYLFVHHIPVIHNVKGVGDLITLGNVLREQGLSVQFGTDAEGNVARYTTLHQLCYHARGANTISVGSEHMHYGVDEPWTERQYRAAAWCVWKAHTEVGIPIRGARLVAAAGITRVRRSGHTSHMRQSYAAGYRDRTDPGGPYRFHHVYELAEFYGAHGKF
jgi:hypothetical protein